jgi:predicted dinucleotide-utilizing enzyme
MDSIQDEIDQPTTEKKKAGRPKGVFKLKRQIQEYARNPDLALPKTDNQRIKDLKDMLIRSSGKDVVEKMISIALNDGHPAQMAAIKMCVDRTLPVSMFEKDKSQRSAVHITISGIGGVDIGEKKNVIDSAEDVDYTIKNSNQE